MSACSICYLRTLGSHEQTHDRANNGAHCAVNNGPRRGRRQKPHESPRIGPFLVALFGSPPSSPAYLPKVQLPRLDFHGSAPTTRPPRFAPNGSASSGRPHGSAPTSWPPQLGSHGSARPTARPPQVGPHGSNLLGSASLDHPLGSAPSDQSLPLRHIGPVRSARPLPLGPLGSATLGPAFLGSAPLEQLRPLGAIRPALSARPHRTSTLGSAPLDQPARIGPSRSDRPLRPAPAERTPPWISLFH